MLLPENFPAECWDCIRSILQKGLSAEIKIEKQNIVVVELSRKAKIKVPASGQAVTANRG